MTTLKAPARPARANARRAEQHRQTGVLALRARQWPQAIAEFLQATRLAPADALMWMNLARAQLGARQLTEAKIGRAHV